MSSMRVAGVPPWDGEYPLDVSRPFNGHEWHLITRRSGYMPMTIGDGFAGRDPMLFVVFATIAMSRARKIDRNQWDDVVDQLAEAPFNWEAITLVLDASDEADNEVPLESTRQPGEPSLTASQ